MARNMTKNLFLGLKSLVNCFWARKLGEVNSLPEFSGERVRKLTELVNLEKDMNALLREIWRMVFVRLSTIPPEFDLTSEEEAKLCELERRSSP